MLHLSKFSFYIYYTRNFSFCKNKMKILQIKFSRTFPRKTG
ncbi:hypothetical protein CLOSTMETH_01670 [[Clostridium] methylpentosum DSM 5476]|uniref:Uncharacterized protein n=1 Tax=[Clostridium] methylpentosum DSM 5476 TaxID=537013 RepID=C0ECU9_9FIRM|nr:hypothetical protein CLOSTMETH_01670 [[Clostridium] methylpentosum DSM 5476]